MHVTCTLSNPASLRVVGNMNSLARRENGTTVDLRLDSLRTLNRISWLLLSEIYLHRWVWRPQVTSKRSKAGWQILASAEECSIKLCSQSIIKSSMYDLYSSVHWQHLFNALLEGPGVSGILDSDCRACNYRFTLDQEEHFPGRSIMNSTSAKQV